jgi:hypothetical protein
MDVILIAVQLVTLYGLDGRAIIVNPAQVTSIREARDDGDSGKLFADKVHCVIRLTDASYVTVAEDCDRVRELMEGAKP